MTSTPDSMRVPFVDLKVQSNGLRKKLMAAVEATFDESVFIAGAQVNSFEDNFAQQVEAKFCISCANGTDGLEIALESLGVAKGDEVLVPALSWISTASAVVRVGAKPVFVEVDPDYYTIDVADAAQKITSLTKAVIPVHLYGLPANMIEIMTLADKFKLKVIEDCAQAPLAAIENHQVGTFGDAGVFSFYPSKNLGGYGDGGAMVTNNPELAKELNLVGRMGSTDKHTHKKIGRNSRLDTIQAAMLSVKLPFLAEWTAKRRRVARLYNNEFADVNLKTPKVPNGYKHVFHNYVLQVDKRDELASYLKENGIGTQIHYPQALSDLELFAENKSCAIASDLCQKIISLPLYPELTDPQISMVVEHVKKFILRNG